MKDKNKTSMKAVEKAFKKEKIATTKSKTYQSGQDSRKKAYADKTPVKKAEERTKTYGEMRKSYTPAKANGMSRNQVVELHRTSEDIQEGIKSKKKFDYDTTRPATPLKTIGKSQIKSWNKRLKRGL